MLVHMVLSKRYYFYNVKHSTFFMLLQEGEHMSSLAMDRTIIIDFAFFSPLFYSTIIDTTGVL
jgi:hypothetical protein